MAEKQAVSVIWRDVPIEITFTRHVFGQNFDHVELRAPQPLPVTQTGYRSHFMPHDPDLDLDRLKTWVIAWLDEKSQDKSWRDWVQRSKQGDLFEL
tara:strand:+ start:3557 stop:3844 length:288 start_codon:yes stop_codon:yes gene_type:complete